MVALVAADTLTQLAVPGRQTEVAEGAAPPDVAWPCAWEAEASLVDAVVARVEVVPPEEGLAL